MTKVLNDMNVNLWRIWFNPVYPKASTKPGLGLGLGLGLNPVYPKASTKGPKASTKPGLGLVTCA